MFGLLHVNPSTLRGEQAIGHNGQARQFGMGIVTTHRRSEEYIYTVYKYKSVCCYADFPTYLWISNTKVDSLIYHGRARTLVVHKAWLYCFPMRIMARLLNEKTWFGEVQKQTPRTSLVVGRNTD